MLITYKNLSKIIYFAHLFISANSINAIIRHVNLSPPTFEIQLDQSQVLWSILICSLPSRASNLEYITKKLSTQIQTINLNEKIEIVIFMDYGEHTTGYKRNTLLQQSRGKYISFIDDDDDISNFYIVEIYQQLLKNPDTVELSGIVTCNNTLQEISYRSIHLKNAFNVERLTINAAHFTIYLNDQLLQCAHSKEKAPDKLSICCSWVTHLNPIRRSIALKCQFPDITLSEDTDYAIRLIKSNLLVKEFPTSGFLYFQKRKTTNVDLLCQK